MVKQDLDGLKKAIIERIDKVSTDVRGEIQELRKEVEDLKEDLKGGLESVHKTIDAKLVEAKEDIWDELRDRERRKRNVIIYNLVETQGCTPKDDVTDLLAKMSLETYDGMLVFSRRLGKVNQDEPKPRPIVARFLHDQLKEEVLQRAHTLPDCGFKDVYIHPDLTEVQRKEHKALHSMAEVMNKSKKGDLDRKGQKYIVVGRRGEAKIILKTMKSD